MGELEKQFQRVNMKILILSVLLAVASARYYPGYQGYNTDYNYDYGHGTYNYNPYPYVPYLRTNTKMSSERPATTTLTPDRPAHSVTRSVYSLSPTTKKRKS